MHEERRTEQQEAEQTTEQNSESKHPEQKNDQHAHGQKSKGWTEQQMRNNLIARTSRTEEQRMDRTADEEQSKHPEHKISTFGEHTRTMWRTCMHVCEHERER